MKKRIINELKASIKKISISERIIFTTSFIWIISCFLNWFSYSQIEDFDNKIIIFFNAFDWIWAVLWYFYFLCILSILTIILLKNKKEYIKNFLEQKNWIYLFLNWQALFISICALLIYSAYWLNNAYSEIWIWIYIAIISQLIWVFASHYYFLKNNKNKIKNFEVSITKYR